MKSKIYSIVISLSFLLVFALNAAADGIQPAFENVLAQQDSNSSMYPNLNFLVLYSSYDVKPLEYL